MITFLCCSWKNYPELFLLLKAIRVKIMPVKNDTLSSHISSLPVIQQQFSSTFVLKDFLFYFIFPPWVLLQPELPLCSASGAEPPPVAVLGDKKCPEQSVGDNFVMGKEEGGHRSNSCRAQQGFHPRDRGTDSWKCHHKAWESQFLQVWWMWWPESLNSYLFAGRKVIISVRLSIVSVWGWDKDMLCVFCFISRQSCFFLAHKEYLISVAVMDEHKMQYIHMINTLSRPN